MDKYQSNKILIVHSNLQTAQKIARTIRNLKFFSEVINLSELENTLIENTPCGIISDLKNETTHIINNVKKSIDFFDINHTNLDVDEDVAALERFIKGTQCQPIWTINNIIEYHINNIKQQIGKDEVILGLSGGVDSSVVAALIHKAIGNQLTCVFVDTGLMRLHEGDNIMRTFADNMGIKIIRVNAEDRFLTELKGENNPENKRKIIGKLFIDIFDEEAQKLSQAKWLAQGTIYPDILESIHTKDGVAVKSHHNVGGLPEHMNFKLLEPLNNLFKNEVRELGIALGLPKEMVYRHPFPGPGLGVRIIGEIKKEYADILRLADDIFITELRKAGLYDKVSQAFAVFIPVKSVGVVDNTRVYEYVVSLRAIETVDFMIARAAHLPHNFLEHVSNRIITEVAGISRVTYDISNKPPATIEWE